MTAGEAIPWEFAPLKGSSVVQARSPTDVIRLILVGTRATPTDVWPTAFAMPTFAWKLDDAQLAAVATYARNSWGNAAPPVSVAQVRTDVADEASKAGKRVAPPPGGNCRP